MIEFITEENIKQISFDFILDKLRPVTAYGKTNKKNLKPYLPGMEKDLIRELDKVEDTIKILNKKELINVFRQIKDLSETFERSKNEQTLDVIELFEIKNFLIQIESLAKKLKGSLLSKFGDLQVTPISCLSEKLDPRKDKLKTFYIYDEYSETLKNIRTERKNIELGIKKEKKIIKDTVKDKYNLRINLRNEAIVSKTKEEKINRIKKDNLLTMTGEDYLNVIFTIKNTDKITDLEKKLNNLIILEEEEELKIRQELTLCVKKEYENIIRNIKAIGKIDLLLSKAIFAEVTNSVKPKITEKHIIDIKNGRHLKVENMVKKISGEYIPVSINLKSGATCITGANMGGKTVSLKMVGQIVAAAQYGLYIPCDYAEIGLSNYIYISTGDSQSIEQGLSTFGAEISGLRNILENSDKRGLLLIDELARGTNPAEGYAITKAVINYLKEENSITIVTTHYDNASSDKGVKRLQVAGLVKMDEDVVKQQLLMSSERGIETISQYMDYRLIEVENLAEVPKDAIRIARLMGLKKEIINEAENLLK